MTRNETRPGCLAAVFNLFGFQPRATTAARTQLPDGATNVRTEPLPSVPESQLGLSEPLPYRVRDDFLSAAELSFYHVLRAVAGDKAVVQTKVGLGDLFFVSRPHENQAARARIAQKHLDFLLCHPKTLVPMAGIELDDSSHARDDRQERDEFVNRVFEAAGLPLVRFPVRHAYHTGEVTERLAPFLAEAPAGSAGSAIANVPPAAAADGTSEAPLCPKCGIPMVLRTASRGDRRGEQFYGCRNYPQCRAMLPYNPALRA